MSILWNFDKYAKIEELPFDPLCINDDNLIPISDVELLLKAGTPLVLAVEEEDEGGGDDAKGATKKGATKIAEPPSYTTGTVHVLDQESAPTCFAAEDYHFILTNAQQPKLVKCVTKGYIEKAKVLEAMGEEEDPGEDPGEDIKGPAKVAVGDPTADWAESLAALGLYLVDDLGALPGSSGGGGGGGDSRTVWYGVAAQSSSDVGEVYKNAAHTETVSADELSAAFHKELVIVAGSGPMSVDMIAVGIMYSDSDLMGVYCVNPNGGAVAFGPSEQDGPDIDS